MASKITKIWRVENAKGVGPYREAKYGGHLSELTELGFNNDEDVNRPPPERDLILRDSFNLWSKQKQKKWSFGFKSLRDYRYWFNQKAIRQFLSDNGYFLSQYEVDSEKAILGDKQVIFQFKGAKLIAFRACDLTPIKATRLSDLPKEIKALVKNKTGKRHLKL